MFFDTYESIFVFISMMCDLIQLVVMIVKCAKNDRHWFRQ